MTTRRLNLLLAEIRHCTVCEPHLPLGPAPVLAAGHSARLLVVGQAPGKRVHASGVPWDDPSGDRLRLWLGVERKTFYDQKKIALVPMGFCYPGTGKSGDLPPRTECAELWHAKLLALMPAVKVTVLLSRYAHAYYLANRRKKSLTETVKAWRQYGPQTIPLPHPSPRNNIWLKKNPWFEAEVLPWVKGRVAAVLAAS